MVLYGKVQALGKLAKTVNVVTLTSGAGATAIDQITVQLQVQVSNFNTLYANHQDALKTWRQRVDASYAQTYENMLDVAKDIAEGGTLKAQLLS